ncbi:NAD binding domain of 6-phosphogluconate dehydrogenase-domain-containing protein [Bisporella sp. PMI_857]|nr:NAD binding domain of 6-phosphogluconate dehydrogenase-domain-containing protein [Bisporella sp. PMI_857]
MYKIGFIGLGVMGFPMAKNLVEKLPETSSFWIFDVSVETLHKFSETANKFVHICSSSKEVAENSNIIFTMVPEGVHVRSVYLTPGLGLLAADLESRILIDCSTIDTATSNLVREELSTKYPSTSFYDAPVSGGSLGADKAALTFMLGASSNDPNMPLLKTLLGTMGTSTFVCGGPSMGLTAKLCNNYCSGLVAIATAEAMNIGMKAGMDPRILASIFSTSTAQSTISDKWNPVPGICPEAPASHAYEGGFKVQLMKKDFGLAVDTANAVNAKLLLGRAGLQAYTDASNDKNCRDRDSRVVFRFLGGDEEWLKRYSDENR